MSAEKCAVLLLAHGTPDCSAEVPEFLRYVTGGRGLPPAVVEEIKHRYSAIGRSPLTEITLRQASSLQKHIGIPVTVGMRNWKPFIAEAITQMVNSGITRAVAICMAPQNSRTSVGLYRKAVLDAASDAIEIDFIEEWHDHPLLIKAFAEKLRLAWREATKGTSANVPVIFTAHSVPAKTIAAGDPYETQVRKTADLVAAQVPEIASELTTFAFQSQGKAAGEWLGPTVEDTILGLKAEGHKRVLVQPIGFLCDHVEVLYDIDIMFKNFAAEHGVKLMRTESLNDSSLLAEALADLATTALRRMHAEHSAIMQA
jgi:ferrochelatase